MNMVAKTDGELLKELVAVYSNPEINSQDKVMALTDIEYYVHQVQTFHRWSDQT